MDPNNTNAIDTARIAANTAADTANNFVAGGYSLADELRKAVGERFGESPVANDAATARSDFMAAAPQARSDVLGMVQGGTILSPTQQLQIIAAKRAAALVPLTAANTMQEATFGTMQDLINAGTNAYTAQGTKLQGAATLAEKSYTDLLNELVTKAQLANAGSTASGSWSNFTDADGKVWALNSKTGEKKLLVETTKGNNYTSDLSDAAKAIQSGQVTKDEAMQRMLSAYPDKASNIAIAFKNINSPKPWYQFW